MTPLLQQQEQQETNVNASHSLSLLPSHLFESQSLAQSPCAVKFTIRTLAGKRCVCSPNYTLAMGTEREREKVMLVGSLIMREKLMIRLRMEYGMEVQ